MIWTRTNDAQEFIVPFQLQRNYSRQFLQAVFIWLIATGITGEWAIDRIGEVLANGMFVALMSVVFVCVGIAYIEALCERSKMRQR